MKPAVWITGLGVVSSLGRDLESFFAGLLRGEPGLSEIEGIPTTRGKTLGGQVKDPAFSGPHRLVEMAVSAVEEAIGNAGWSDSERAQAGLFVGTAAGESQVAESHYARLRDAAELDDTLRDALLCHPVGALADVIAERTRVAGPREVNTNACASGNIALARALMEIQQGRLERAVVCGADQLKALTYWGTERAGLMGKDLRPFHRHREGTVFGDGAAAIVLERRDVAEQRHAHGLARLAGWSVVCDEDPQLILPQLDGGAAVRCLLGALHDAHLAADEVDYVNAHGTGTVNIDRVETVAVKRVFGERAGRVPVNSTKSLTGHLSAASAVVEAVASVLAISRGYIHPTAKLDEPDPELGLDFVPLKGRYQPVSVALSNSMGGGGTNSAVAFTSVEYPERAAETGGKPAAACEEEVVISGAGCVSAAGTGRQALMQALLGEPPGEPVGRITDFDVNRFVDPSLQYEYLSRTAQLSLVAGILALDDAGYKPLDRHPDRVAVVFGTQHGGTPGWSDLLASAYHDDPKHITPSMALEHGHHLGVTLVARYAKARGANFTLTTGRTAGLDAIAVGASLLQTGQADVVLVGGSDALDPALERAVKLLGCMGQGSPLPYDARATGFRPSEGAGCLVLERRADAQQRGARVLGGLVGVGRASVATGPGGFDVEGAALSRAMSRALKGVAPTPPVTICGTANGTPQVDTGEVAAVSRVLESEGRHGALISLNGCIGETFAASGPLSLIGGMSLLDAGRAPTWGFRADDRRELIPALGAPLSGNVLLATAAGMGGTASAVAVRVERGAVA